MHARMHARTPERVRTHACSRTRTSASAHSRRILMQHARTRWLARHPRTHARVHAPRSLARSHARMLRLTLTRQRHTRVHAHGGDSLSAVGGRMGMLVSFDFIEATFERHTQVKPRRAPPFSSTHGYT